MRTILLLRGCPASGKSTWVKNNHLEPYTLSADNIRLLVQSPVLNKEGEYIISQKNDGLVWETLYNLLEQRMARGEFVVVDATHYRAELLRRYKDIIDKYRYRAYIIDFTSVPKEECLERNKLRPQYQVVPNDVIEKMCSVFEAERDGLFKEISNKFTVLPFENAMEIIQSKIEYDLTDEYEKVVVFGDIHGCYQPLKEYFEKNPIQNNTEYIFVGDYLDRGIQNKEMIQFLSDNRTRSNFLFLEGNHELWLRKYCDKDYVEFRPTPDEKKILNKYVGKKVVTGLYNKNIKSREFINNTMPQIEGFNKGELRQICRKLAQFTFFKFGSKKYLVTHGGLPRVPDVFTSTEELIKGVGQYEDINHIHDEWHLNTNDNIIQIHGHRNILKDPIENGRCYNLCDSPETGGNLRILEISRDGNLTPIYIKNTIFNKDLDKKIEKVEHLVTKSDNKILEDLNNSKWVTKKILSDNIISYNFSRDAFYKKHWDEIICKARGLFVDRDEEKVVCRSYEKFFNWSETEETSSRNLCKTLIYPVQVFKKENGFLALISYNKKTDDLLICSKSTNQGDYVEYIKDSLKKVYTSQQIDGIKNYCKENNVTMIFECIRPVEDPHIIRYKSEDLILLDIVKNSFNAEFLSWDELQEVAKLLNLHLKELVKTFDNWEGLHNFKEEISDHWNCKDEGYVMRDNVGFMVKVKSKYYRWWKGWRGIKEKMQKGQNIKKVFTSPLDVEVYRILASYNNDELASKSIIDIAEEFYSKVSLDIANE